MYVVAVSALKMAVLLTAMVTSNTELNLILKDTGANQQDIQMIMEIGRQTGIHGETLISIWMKETSCGDYLGKSKPKEVMNGSQYKAFLRICQATGRDPEVELCSSAGAIGVTQFMPLMWEHYGVDADGDGIANPWSLKDAATASAKFLLDHNYNSTPWQAVCSYNGGPKCRVWSVQHYTNVVLRRAARWGAPLDL